MQPELAKRTYKLDDKWYILYIKTILLKVDATVCHLVPNGYFLAVHAR